MKVLLINSDVSNIKFSLLESDDMSIISFGVVDKIGTDNSYFSINCFSNRVVGDIVVESHEVAAKIILDKLVDLNVIKSYDDIKSIGYKVRQGYDRFFESVVLNDGILNDLIELSDKYSIHNRGVVLGINSFKKIIPNTFMVLVFDSCFYKSIPVDNYLYGIPYKWFLKYGVRKYGYHGLNHQYNLEYITKLLKKDSISMISCYIDEEEGSICAISENEAIDISCGFGLSSGILIGSRCGDVDVSVIPYIMEMEGKNANEVVNDLNNKSGLLGLSEYSVNMTDILQGVEEGNLKAIYAKNKFIRSVVNYIAEYFIMLGNVKTIVFSGSIFEKHVEIRREVCEKLSCLGVEIDLDKNSEVLSSECKISMDKSSLDVYVLPSKIETIMINDILKLYDR